MSRQLMGEIVSLLFRFHREKEGENILTDTFNFFWHSYILRMFCIAFTKRDKSQKDNPVATAYAQTAQIRQIRKKMVEIMTRESVTCDLKELVNKFILKLMSDEITKSCKSIYPLQDVYIRKVRIKEQDAVSEYLYNSHARL